MEEMRTNFTINAPVAADPSAPVNGAGGYGPPPPTGTLTAQGMPFRQGQEFAEEENVSFDVIGLLIRQKWLMILGVVIGLVLGYLYAARVIPIYQSSARVLVIKQKSKMNLEEMDRLVDSDETIGTHIEMVRSPVVVESAIKKHNLANLPSLAAKVAANEILLNLSATGGDNILIVSMRAQDPQDAAVITNAVIDSYQEFLGETYQSLSSETINFFNKAKVDLDKTLVEQKQKYHDFLAATPGVISVEKALSTKEASIHGYETARSGEKIKRMQLESQVDQLRRAKDKGMDINALLLTLQNQLFSTEIAEQIKPSDASVSQRIDALRPMHNIAMTPDEQLLNQKRLQLQLNLDTWGEEHPKVRALNTEIAILSQQVEAHRHRMAEEERKYRDQLQKEKERIAEATKNGDKPKEKGLSKTEMFDFAVMALDQQIEILTAREKLYDDQIGSEMKIAKELSLHANKEEALKSDIARTQGLFDSVLKRLQQIDLIKDRGGFLTRVLNPAKNGAQVQPNIPRIMTTAGILGLLAGLGLGYLLEMSSNSFRSPQAIRRDLRLPVIGHIPMFNTLGRQKAVPSERPDLVNIDPSLCTIHRPRSADAEAFRSLRTAMFFSTAAKNYRLVQITSPDVSDGKSTISTNLAVSIAQSGKKTLLIDADLRRPRVHKIFGCSPDSGIVDIIQRKLPIESCVQSTPVNNLSLMACGGRVPNPAELLVSPEFERTLRDLAQMYDFVLVDTPPLLAVTDPCAVAARVDAVVMVLRIGNHARSKALRACEILDSIGANCMGVIVNESYSTSGSFGKNYSAYTYYRSAYYGRYAHRAYTQYLDS